MLARYKTLCKKARKNPHYGCVEKCCDFLHSWNVCKACIVHRLKPLKVEDPARIREVQRFQRVFSQLPEDIHRYINEFVPAIFELVRLVARIPRNRLLDSYVNLPRSAWKTSLNLKDRYFISMRLDCDSSRKGICESVKTICNFANGYNKQHLIREHDFATSREIRRSTKMAKELIQIKNDLYAAKKMMSC